MLMEALDARCRVGLDLASVTATRRQRQPLVKVYALYASTNTVLEESFQTEQIKFGAENWTAAR